MTKQDTAKILFILRATFPAAYKNMSTKEFENVINVWTVLFKDYSYQAVEAGVNACIMATTSDFPPSPGMIVDQIADQADNGVDALEAWAMVKRALRNGLIGYDEEYAKLPPLVQRALGGSSTIHEWAALEDETSKNVAQSQFLSQYRAICVRAKAESKIPKAVKDAMRNNLPEGMTPKIEAPKAEAIPQMDLPMDDDPEKELPFVDADAQSNPFDNGRIVFVEEYMKKTGLSRLRDMIEA